jgi:hypothetical protein
MGLENQELCTQTGFAAPTSRFSNSIIPKSFASEQKSYAALFRLSTRLPFEDTRFLFYTLGFEQRHVGIWLSSVGLIKKGLTSGSSIQFNLI